MSWTGILASVLVLGGVGAVFGSLIALANRRLWIWEDPRIDAAADMLPGTNCGACGEAGCRVFAEKLVAGAIEPAACTVMGHADVDELAVYLGIDAGAAVKEVARLLCAGGADVTPRNAEYRGLQTCRAAATVAGGAKGCTWGCLGLGDCERSCRFEAIRMSPVDLPVVVPDLCTACKDCVEACPKDLFVMMPIEHKLIVQCKSALEGDAIEALCPVACNACGKCVADAAPGLIEMRDGLAVIDYTRNDLATPAATARCPTAAIVWVEGAQFGASGAGPASRAA